MHGPVVVRGTCQRGVCMGCVLGAGLGCLQYIQGSGLEEFHFI